MIGFIGLGIMGSRMANNLIEDGQELIVYNRTKEKAQPLLDKGAKWANSPIELAEQVDVIFTMLAKPEIVQHVAIGDNGFLPAMKDGSLWVDCSTVGPVFSRKMAEEALSRNIRFVDAPVLGSKIPAEKGELVFVVGGHQKDIEAIQPYLDVMGKSVKYQGEHGQGSSMKLVVNSMLAQTMIAFSEAIALGESLNLGKENVVDTLLNGPTTAPFLKAKRSHIMGESTDVEFAIDYIQKDLHLASLMAYEESTALPFINLAKELYALAKVQGKAKEDMSTIYQALYPNHE
ncbi:NAD-binding protein [Terrilactibacillus sp. BCM23-1]|uniref:NAD-binding protein n=1 Tax=Terrilactibacillus tamarindi TaxID=2599694 RepID=A0A6N8CS09_9BACI|nr:NAD(P)-dependent oxidoreductase [Terrilactibacillus tamarindi]MTT30766.1 NAD-binding protein [Terrilactibacillus tamarindi]